MGVCGVTAGVAILAAALPLASWLVARIYTTPEILGALTSELAPHLQAFFTLFGFL